MPSYHGPPRRLVGNAAMGMINLDEPEAPGESLCSMAHHERRRPNEKPGARRAGAAAANARRGISRPPAGHPDIMMPCDMPLNSRLNLGPEGEMTVISNLSMTPVFPTATK